jgi:predicted amidohydrolase
MKREHEGQVESLRIAMVTMHSKPGAADWNLDRMEAFAERAVQEGAEIVCFPELSVTGYVLENPERLCPEGGFERAADRVSRMTEGLGITILAGIIEAARPGKPYISQIVAGPEGRVGVYRKTHLSPSEKAGYRSGDRLRTFCVEKRVFGIELCYESHFPEISTVLALSGAQVLFLPHASPRGTAHEKLESWLRHLTARAFDNAVFIAACNQVGNGPAGLTFPGVSVIIGPDGRVMDQYVGGDEHLLVATLDLGGLDVIRKHRMKFFLPHRRPDLYGPVSSAR